MSQRCDQCGKQPSFGNSVIRLGRNALVRRVKSRTRRRWLPNLQTTHRNGHRQRLCVSCLRCPT